MTDCQGNTPLDLAVQSGDRETTRFLRTLGGIANTSSESEQNRLLSSDQLENLDQEERYELSVQSRLDYANTLRRRKREIDPQRRLMVIRRRMAYDSYTGEDPITAEMRALREERVVRAVQKMWRGWRLRKRLRDIVKESRAAIREEHRHNDEMMQVEMTREAKQDLMSREEIARKTHNERARTEFMQRLKRLNAARRRREYETGMTKLEDENEDDEGTKLDDGSIDVKDEDEGIELWPDYVKQNRSMKSTESKRITRDDRVDVGGTENLVEFDEAFDEGDVDMIEPDTAVAFRRDSETEFYRSASMKRGSILPPGLTVFTRKQQNRSKRIRRIHDILARLRLMLEVMSGEKGWYYVDKRNVVRGPYESEKMRHWFVRGYLTLDVQCSRDGGNVFHKLRDYYVGNTEPFLEAEDPDHSFTGLLALVRALGAEV